MKRGIKAISICLISLWMGFVIAWPAAAGPPTPPVSQFLPDLAIRLKLITSKKDVTGGVTCYAKVPKYTVTNLGHAAVGKFSVKVYYKGQGHPGFKFYSVHNNYSLKPGESVTFNASENGQSGLYANWWCADETGKVGFRVIAVYDGKEKSKRNNIATRLFPSSQVRKDKKNIPRVKPRRMINKTPKPPIPLGQ